VYSAAERGVDFRLLVDAGAESSLVSESFRKLRAFPFPHLIKIKALGLSQKLHAKIYVCDDVFFYVGSHNLTKRALQNPLEVGIAGRDPVLSLTLKTLFLTLWGVAHVG
jgi:phosphatidylserine/phosphatidylglycerophosphate/cardiolipin synthase-like enzyme